MRQLDAYIMRTVAMTMILALIGLVGILSIFTFLEQIEDIRNDYDVVAVIMYCIYSMPRLFYEGIPFAAMIGCLAGLGLLAGNSELLIMRAAGVSTWAISVSTMKPVLALVAIGLLVGELFLPDLERVARNNRTQAMSGEDQIAPYLGFWYREGPVYMHFGQVHGNVLGGVSHYYFDESNSLVRTLYAARAVYQDVRREEKYWMMEDVLVTDVKGGQTESHRIVSQRWDSRLTPELLRTEILVQPDRMSINELSSKIEYLKAQGLNSGKFEVGYWQKVLQPIATIGLVFVAISFIFGPLRESTMGMRVVSGLIVGIVFKFLQGLLSPASLVYGFSPLIAVVIPIVLCFGFGYFLLRRAH